MLESDIEDTGCPDPAFALSVTEALSVYTLYSVFQDEVMEGVEDEISRQELPVELRPDLRAAIPDLIADLREFLREHAHSEIMADTEAKIAEILKAKKA